MQFTGIFDHINNTLKKELLELVVVYGQLQHMQTKANTHYFIIIINYLSPAIADQARKSDFGSER